MSMAESGNARTEDETPKKLPKGFIRPGYTTTAGSEWLREKAERTIQEYEDREDADR